LTRHVARPENMTVFLQAQPYNHKHAALSTLFEFGMNDFNQ
jgi:hypothetical protein